MNTTQTEYANVDAAIRALKVLTLTPATVTFLLENDPQALLQALQAVRPFTTCPSQIETLDDSLLAVSAALRTPDVHYLTKLTELEAQVLPILQAQAEACSGGDFGIIEEVKVSRICSRQALGGILTSLQAKGILTVWEPTEVNGGTRYASKVTQFTFNNR